MSTKAATTAAPAETKPENQKVELGLLEEDDEFEEFEAEDWNEAEKDTDLNNQEANLWEDNWDDDNVEDDFTNQLR
jgi:26 proteasome complex subunit DSS1